MKKILITSILIFVVLASILNTIYATNNYIDNSFLNAAQNAAEKYNQAVKNEQAALDEYKNYLNSLSQNKDTNSSQLPQTGLSTNIYIFSVILCAVAVYTIFKIIKYKDI